MNIVLVVICCVSIAFAGGFLAREAIDFGKLLIQSLKRIKVEIDMNNSGTIPERRIPPNPSDERFKIPSQVIDKTANSGQLR